jgi:hypothetical protein
LAVGVDVGPVAGGVAGVPGCWLMGVWVAGTICAYASGAQPSSAATAQTTERGAIGCM